MENVRLSGSGRYPPVWRGTALFCCVALGSFDPLRSSPGKSRVAIENQALLATATSILIAMLFHQVLGGSSPSDEKALRKHDKRQTACYRGPDGTDSPNWAAPLYRFTTKISRQMLRFFQSCFDRIASTELYQRQLRPMFQTCL